MSDNRKISIHLKENYQSDYGKEILVEDLKNVRVSKSAKPFQVYHPFSKNSDHLESNEKLINIINKNINKDLRKKNKLNHKIHLNCIPSINKAKINFYSHYKLSELSYESLNKFIKNKRINQINKSTQICQSKESQTLGNVNKEQIKLNVNWIALKNNEGIEFYLNLLNGMTTYDVNYVKETQKPNWNFQDTKKNLEISKTFSKELGLSILYNNQVNRSILVNIDKFDYLNYQITNTSIDFNDSKIFLDRFKIDLSIFESLNIIGQFDLKFIVASYEITKLNGYTLILFDQHACHERVRLEQIIQENMNSDFELICADSFNETIKFKLDTIFNETVVELFKLKMKSYGFYIDIINENTSNDKYLVMYKLPKILVNKFWRDQTETINFLRDFMEDIFQLCILDQKNPYLLKKKENFKFSQIPKQLLEVFNMEACRSAIKFGDKLSIKECETLIQDLKKCKLPFQCAHGRPTLAPVINVINKKETKRKLNLKKLNEIEIE